MLELRLAKTSMLKKAVKVIDSIGGLSRVAVFDFSATGLSIYVEWFGEDTLVKVLLTSEDFEYYRCEGDIDIVLDITTMNKMLGFAEEDDDDVITLKYDDDTAGNRDVTLVIESPHQGMVSNLRIENLGHHRGIDETRFREAKYDATVTMPSSKLARIFVDLNNFTDIVKISVTEEEVKFSAPPMDSYDNHAFVVCKQKDNAKEPTVIKISKPEVSLSMHSLHVIANAATSLSNTVALSLSENHWMVEYKNGETGCMKFYCMDCRHPLSRYEPDC